MKKLFIITLLISQISFAQNASDALMISQSKIGGSARFQAMGGAFTALGGELSATQLNPAGASIFLDSQISFSYGSSNIDNKTSFYDGGGSSDNIYNNINQLGMVFIIKNDDNASSINKYAISVNYNRTNNFHDNLSFNGNNNTQLEVYSGNNLMYEGYSSLATSFALAANGFSPDRLMGAEGLAFDTYLIDINDPTSKYYDSRYPDYSDSSPVYVISSIPNNTHQDYNMSRSGHSGQYTFSGGMDIDDKLYLGASYNRSSINTVTDISLKESQFDPNSDLSEFTYKSYVSTVGYGNGFSLGAIYRASDMIRIGAAYHSPTWYKLSDEYNYSIETKFKTPDGDGNKNYYSESNYKYFDYELSTPFKVDAGIAFVLGKKGLFSADYEYIGYSSMKLGSNYDFEYENRDIKNTMNSTHNIRIGTEWKVSFVSLRGGYSFSQSPYKNTEWQSNTQSFSLGGGLNFKTWKLDLSYQKYTNSYNYYIYEVDLVDAARVNRNESNIVATLRIAM